MNLHRLKCLYDKIISDTKKIEKNGDKLIHEMVLLTNEFTPKNLSLIEKINQEIVFLGKKRRSDNANLFKKMSLLKKKTMQGINILLDLNELQNDYINEIQSNLININEQMTTNSSSFFPNNGTYDEENEQKNQKYINSNIDKKDNINFFISNIQNLNGDYSSYNTSNFVTQVVPAFKKYSTTKNEQPSDPGLKSDDPLLSYLNDGTINKLKHDLLSNKNDFPPSKKIIDSNKPILEIQKPITLDKEISLNEKTKEESNKELNNINSSNLTNEINLGCAKMNSIINIDSNETKTCVNKKNKNKRSNHINCPSSPVKVLKNNKIVYINPASITSSNDTFIKENDKKITFINRGKRGSHYRGVSKNGNQWQVLVMFNKNKSYIGSFDNEEIAARIYDVFALRNRGFKAKTNFFYSESQLKDIYNIDIKSKDISRIISQMFYDKK